MATLNDVAALAQVSVSVVSRVLRNARDARVSEHTRSRIIDAAESLNYRPNFAGRALRLARSRIIALVVPDVTNAIFAELMEGVEQAALASDYTVLIGRAEDMQPGGVTLQRLVGERRVDGLLVQVRDDPGDDEIASLTASPAPVVFINSVHGHTGIGSVVLPDRAGAELATGHLLDLGHTEIGMIGGNESSYTAGERAAGFRAALEGSGLTLGGERLLHAGYSAQSGRNGLRMLMAQPCPPTAIFVANINAALGALLEARAIGIRVPDDLSIVAMHDAWTAQFAWPPLTTVRMPLRELGSRSVAQLLRRIEDPSAPPQDLRIDDVSPQLVVRDSTGPSGVAS